MAAERFVIEVHRSKHSHAYQLSISTLDEEGLGGGYRLHGPKFCGCHGSESILQHEITERDINELRRFLDGAQANFDATYPQRVLDAMCGWPLSHRDLHPCACVCIAPTGHDGPHVCNIDAKNA